MQNEKQIHQIYDKDRDKLKNTILEMTEELQEEKEKNIGARIHAFKKRREASQRRSNNRPQ